MAFGLWELGVSSSCEPAQSFRVRILVSLKCAFALQPNCYVQYFINKPFSIGEEAIITMTLTTYLCPCSTDSI